MFIVCLLCNSPWLSKYLFNALVLLSWYRKPSGQRLNIFNL